MKFLATLVTLFAAVAVALPVSEVNVNTNDRAPVDLAERGIFRDSVHGDCKVPRRLRLDLHGHCVDTNVNNACLHGMLYPNQCPGTPNIMCCVT